MPNPRRFIQFFGGPLDGHRQNLSERKEALPTCLHLEISSNTLHRWHREFKSHPTQAFSGQGKRMLAESRESQLERKIGQLTMENDFLKKLLKDFEELQENDTGVGSSTRGSGKKRRR